MVLFPSANKSEQVSGGKYQKCCLYGVKLILKCGFFILQNSGIQDSFEIKSDDSSQKFVGWTILPKIGPLLLNHIHTLQHGRQEKV